MEQIILTYLNHNISHKDSHIISHMDSLIISLNGGRIKMIQQSSFVFI